MSIDALKSAIREIPDFPSEGIVFKDITPVLADPVLFKQAVDLFVKRHRDHRIDKVAVIESRGFIFGAVVAYQIGAGLIPVRKKRKLPHDMIEESYALEYGNATVETHVDALGKGERILVIDDLLATGGTAAASAVLIHRLGGEIVEMDFLVELASLGGREKIKAYPVYAPVVY